MGHLSHAALAFCGDPDAMIDRQFQFDGEMG